MQSYSLDFSKLPGGIPPDPSSISMLHMLSVSYPFSPRILSSKGRFKGGSRGTEGLLTPPKYLILKIATKLACTANEISLTAYFQSLSLA